MKSIQSLSIFFNVTLDKTVVDQSVAYQLKLCEHENQVKLENSKKLMFGSLVCLSSDFFQSECIVGVVSERDSKKLKQGLISVRFEFETQAHAQFNNAPEFNKFYTMVETQAYFEAYRHVLEALVSFKDCSAEDFPFKEHLIDCQNRIIKQPEYLRNVPFDFRTIFDFSKKVSIKHGLTTYEFASEVGKKCYLSQEAQWPNAEAMKLDDSQYKAVQLALSSRLALIQGPPGTGKTFIGVKIMELLMNNKSLWWNRPGQPKRPILMICYTNHALDQFLEYCINECHLSSGIVRVGGRCATERLQPFLLSTVKQALRESRQMDPLIYHQIKSCYEDLKQLKSAFEYLEDDLQQISTCGVIEFESLEEVMDAEAYKELREYHQLAYNGDSRYGVSYSMLEWLGFFDLDSFDPSAEYLSSAFERAVTLDQVEDEEETAELEAMNSERLLETDFESLVEQPGRSSYYSMRGGFFAREQIKEMCIAYNKLNGSRHLGRFLADEEQEWMKVKSKKKVEVELTLMDRFIDFKLNELLNGSHCQVKSNSHIWKMNYKERHACYR